MVSFKQVVTYSLVSLCSSIVGYDPGCMNGVLGSEDFKHRYGVSNDGGKTMYLTPTTKSLFFSLVVIGALIGCFIPAAVTNMIGRRGCFLMAGITHIIGVCILLAAPPAAVFILGRIFIGIALGLVTAISGAYLNEASSPSLRGSIFSILQQLVTVGTVLSNGVNWATKSLPGANSWRISVGFQFLIALIMIASGLVAPESPSILVRWGRSADAARSLAITQDRDEACEDIQAIVRRLEHETAGAAGSLSEKCPDYGVPATQPSFWVLFRESFQGTALRRTLIVAAVSAMCLTTGFVFWSSYGTTFLADAGVSDAYMVSFVLALVQFSSTAPTIYLMDRLGRRTLLLAGTSVMGLVMVLAGILYTVDPHSQPSTQMLIAAAVLFMVAYGATWGPVTWVLMAEPLSGRHRIPQTTVTFVVYWVTYLIIGFATPFLVDPTAVNMGPNIAYMWFGGVVIALIWIYTCVPEMTGLSEGQINMLFDQRVPAWRSKAWIRQLLAAENKIGSSSAAAGVVAVCDNSSAETLFSGGTVDAKSDVESGLMAPKKAVQLAVKEVDSSSDSEKE